MKNVALLTTASLALLAGCMPPPPQRVASADVLAALGRPTALKNLRVAVLHSDNAKNTAGYLDRSASSLAGSRANISGVEFFRSVHAVLDRAFASAATMDTSAQAAASGAHLLLVLDAYAKIDNVPFRMTTAEITAEVTTLDGVPVAAIRGVGGARTPYPNMSGPRWPEASRQALDSFELALSTNAQLAAIAAKAVPPPPIAAAAVPTSEVRPLVAPGYRLPQDESKFAFVVGVESYQGLSAAEHAARDAKAVKAHLLAAGYPERNVIFLINAQAGRSALDKYLDAWLPKNTDEKSTVFFYFSGHGAPDTTKGDAYLMPWDGDAKFVESTGYPVKRLYEKLSALKAKRVLVAMDACFSGAGGRSVIAKGLRPLVANVDLGAASSGKVTSLTASAGDEVTGTDEAAGHGLFTYHLLKGLSAKGGKATFKDLYDYLTPKVRDAARRDNRDQTPQLIGSGADSL